MMWTLLLSAFASEPALVDALTDEMARAKAELQLDDSPSIYHLRYKLVLVDEVDVVAELGGILRAEEGPGAGLGVEVRVGEPGWDNTGFGGWQDGFRIVGVPQRPTPHALSLDAWRVTDRSYKDAVEQYSRKQAQAVLPPDHPGDYTLTGPVVHDGGRPAVAALAPLTTLAETLSADMLGPTGLELGQVYIGHETGSLWIVDTEGTRVRRPIHETTIRAVVHLRDDSGLSLTDHRLWTVRDPADLPSLDAMRAEVGEMVEHLSSVAEAPRLSEEYVGPVLFEDGAAADLFRYILLPQLEGTPPEIPFDTFIGDLGEDGGGARLLRRVLPQGWSVTDDPTSVPAHPGSYTHDWEGTEAQSVRFVEDGIVRRVAMSRVPRAGVDGSTGHGRGTLSRRAVGKTSLTTVEPARALPATKLRKLAVKAAASYDRDWVLVVRRLEHPSLRTLGSSELFFGDGPALPAPVEVVRLYADGREEAVKGVSFSQVQRWVLRDIVAAGKRVVHDFLSSIDGDDSYLGPTEGTPCRLTAPAVLIGEMELLPTAADSSEVRSLPPPVVAKP
jgi:hypothetical protein